MKNKKFFNWSDNKIYLIALAIMVVILAIFQPIIALIGALILAYLIFYSFRNADEKNKTFTKYIEGLGDTFDSATKHAIFNMPFPLVLINELGVINWYNTAFLKMIHQDEILNESISELVPSFSMEDLLKREDNDPINLKYGEEYYKVFPNFVDNKKTSTVGKSIVLYWVNNTKFVKLDKHYTDEKTIVGLVYVDNYDDIKNSTPDIHRPLVLAEIDKRIGAYFNEHNGIVRKYENDKFIIIMEHSELRKIKERKIDLLDEIRELDIGNTIPITLSIGISASGEDPITSYEYARAAIDIALGRGGDQAVVNQDGAFDFYGGKSKAVEKRNKVKSRVISYALRQFIDQADTVFVMGHKNPDMDSVGSGIGILRAIKNRNNQGYLILRGENPSIKNIMDRLRIDQPELLKEIITPEQAAEIITKESLMILVDNHKPSFTEAPELLDMVEKRIVIDHHRRGAEFIKDPVLTYVEPYASSTSELVTEILTYISDNLNLTKFEAEALMAGITVDTKNFSFQTGVRTFEAAAVLKRAGADSIVVKQLFRDDFSTFINRAEVVTSAKIIYDKIAIGRLEEEAEGALLIAAQSANELLNINGVEATFVLTNLDEKIHISGRSLGSISVQLILEKLGGGGHLTSAGTQVKDKTMDEVEKMLIEQIDKYLEESDDE